MRASIAAQSQLSVPPAPALISRKVSLPSASPSSSASVSRLRGLVAQRADRRLGVGDDGVVALGLAELDELALVGELAGERLHAVQRVGEGLAVAHQLLGAGGVGPEAGVLGHGVELLEPVLRGLPAHALAQELERLLDLFDEAFGLGAHGVSPRVGPGSSAGRGR